MSLLVLVLLFQVCPTTLDGLPICQRKNVSAAECLRIYPPDSGGGFCEWYGYATPQQADRFEKRRGFTRLHHADGSSDTWKPVTAKAQQFVDCRVEAWANYLDTQDPPWQPHEDTPEHRVLAKCGKP